MHYGGIDLHEKERRICILTKGASGSTAASAPNPSGSPRCRASPPAFCLSRWDCQAPEDHLSRR